jgi:hypothetical protein
VIYSESAGKLAQVEDEKTRFWFSRLFGGRSRILFVERAMVY